MMRKATRLARLALLTVVGMSVGWTGATAQTPNVGIWYSTWYAKKPAVASTWATGFGTGSTNQLIGDVNGDGKDDAVAFAGGTGTWSVALSNGNGFNSSSGWRTGHGTGTSAQFLADADGDGKQDAVAFNATTGAWSVALSNGSGFNAPSTWITGHGVGSTKQFMADANGDGKSDSIVFFNAAGSWYVSLSSGSGFGAYSMWITGHGTGSANQLFGDANGDGKQDAIVFFGDTGTWFAARSSGSSFLSYTTWTSGHGIGSQSQLVSDGNGDGYADAFVFFNSDPSGDAKNGDLYGVTYSKAMGAMSTGSAAYNSGFGYNANKIFQGNVTGDAYGWKASVAFYSSTGTWKVEPYRYNKLNLHDSWTAWNIKYRPLTLGSYQTYDSNDTAVIDEHLANFADAKIDYLLYDGTNGLYVDEGYIFERARTVSSRIAAWNDVAGNRPIQYAMAIGEIQYSHSPQSVEFEAGEVWDRFVNTVIGGTDNYYYLNGKPLLVLYCNGTDRAAWQSYAGDKTNSNKFTVRFAEGETPAGFYGWYTPAAGNNLHNEAMVVMPGWNNHVAGFTPISRAQGDYYSVKSWDRVMTRNPRPQTVVISSFNEYNEDNAIAVTDTSNVTGTTEKWFNKSGVIDNYMYWNMTKNYIRRLANLAFGVASTASSTGESADWGKSRLNDGQLNSVAGSYGYTSQNSLTTNHSEYVQLDLGSAKTISKFDLYPRNDAGNVGQGFPVDFTIQVSTDNVNWTSVVTRTGYALPGNAVQSFSIAPASARYVKVNATSLRSNPNDSNHYRLQFNEVEVY